MCVRVSRNEKAIEVPVCYKAFLSLQGTCLKPDDMINIKENFPLNKTTNLVVIFFKCLKFKEYQ